MAKQTAKVTKKATPKAQKKTIMKSAKKVENKKFPITFITGNKKKLEEFMSIMTGCLTESYNITNQAIDL